MLSEEELREVMRVYVLRWRQIPYRTQADVAKRLDISPQYLCDLLHGHRAISDAVARKLGYKRVVGFEKVED